MPGPRPSPKVGGGRLTAPGGGLPGHRTPPPLITYGRRPVLEALRAGRAVRRVLVVAGTRKTAAVDEIVALAREVGAAVVEAPRAVLDELAEGGHHQGIVAEGAARESVELEDLLAIAAARGGPPLLVVADHLEDPQNLGSLIRSAEAAGAHGLVLPERRSVGVTPAVVRASAGAAEHLAVASVVNLPRALRQLQASGLWVAGLDASATQRYDQADLTGPLALVVGGEGKGLTRLVAESCDLLLRLPLAGRTESLNAAVAGAVALFEAVRQRAGRRTN